MSGAPGQSTNQGSNSLGGFEGGSQGGMPNEESNRPSMDQRERQSFADRPMFKYSPCPAQFVTFRDRWVWSKRIFWGWYVHQDAPATCHTHLGQSLLQSRPNRLTHSIVLTLNPLTLLSTWLCCLHVRSSMIIAENASSQQMHPSNPRPDTAEATITKSTAVIP